MEFQRLRNMAGPLSHLHGYNFEILYARNYTDTLA
jgi:hypothetical protein